MPPKDRERQDATRKRAMLRNVQLFGTSEQRGRQGKHEAEGREGAHMNTMTSQQAIGDALMRHYNVDPYPAKTKPVFRLSWPWEVIKKFAESPVIEPPTGVIQAKLYPQETR